MTDPSGSSQYSYERRGLLKKEWKTIDLDTYGLQYGYDKNGNLNKIRYPSGRLVSYAFDFADRPLSADSSGATYISSALYQPFGPESQINYGNGTRATMTFDQRYRLTVNKLEKLSPLSTIAQSTYALDGVGNVTSIADSDPTYSRTTLAYDDLNRLKTATSGANLWVTGSYTYDDLGSVTSLTMGSRTASFTYTGTTPKLISVNESGINRNVTYDSAGNETAVGSATFTYSARNFLSAADNLTYTYDGRGLRVATALSSTVFPISLTISPVSVVKGAVATGTVTLNAGAPVNGASVALKSSDTAVATVPTSVTVSQFQTAQTFSITTSGSITADAKVVISATYGNVTKSEALTVTTTPRLSMVSVSPRAVQGGSSAIGTVTLNGPASGTATVTLSSSNTGVATVPASVPVSSSQTSATFNITTSAVTASQAVTITASYLGVSRWASLTVMQVLAQGQGAPERGLEEKLPEFHLASLSLGAGSVLRSVRGGDFELFGDDWRSFGLPDFAASESGGVRPMDGPIYSAPGPAKRNHLYSPEMNLLAESEVSTPRDRQILYEYIWFNGHPVAQVDGQTVTHWTFTDHLGTPTLQTDAAANVFWRVEYEPYGRVWTLRPPTLADQHQPLRLPGQEAEQFNLGTNGLTERFYNVFRWYRPNWGRYTQPDPVGLEEGDTDLFLYARDRPLLLIDPFGLRACGPCDDCPSGTWSFQGLGFTAGFFRWGRTITAGTFKCAKGIGLTELKVTIDCKLKGPFVGIGGGVAFSVPGVPSACGCNSGDLLGEQPETTFISAGPAGVELGDCATRGGPTATFGFGRAVGGGSAGLICNVKRRF
jgi:RHS repeat-associated protein